MTSTTTYCLLLAAMFGAAIATWSMSNYACNQPQLYQQCQCQSFCSSYVPSSYTYSNPCYSGYGNCGSGRRRHRLRHKKPRRKFRLDSDSVEVPPPAPRKSKTRHDYSDEEGFIEEKPRKTTTVAPDSSWENEDLWEKKFENRKTSQSSDESLPDFDSSEIETTARPVATAAPATSSGLGGLGLGSGGLFGISSGVGVGVPGVGPIGISSGLGIGK